VLWSEIEGAVELLLVAQGCEDLSVDGKWDVQKR